MKTCIVELAIDINNGREFANELYGKTFKNAAEVKDLVKKQGIENDDWREFDYDDDFRPACEVWEIGEYVEKLNDECYPTDYWVTMVYIND